MSYYRLTLVTMETTKLSAKGQVVLPKGVRDAHGWEPGLVFMVESTPAGVLLRPRSGKREGRIADLAGMLKQPGRKPVSIKAMNDAVAAAAKSRHARGRY